jgi:iron complex outermembrane receptor protein
MIAGLAVLARADEVQQLPAMSVTGSAGIQSLQPSFVIPSPGADPSNGLADAARYTAGFAINDAGARGFGQTMTLRGLGNTPFFSDASAPIYLDDIPLVSAFTFPTALYDFTRVAVNRGPDSGTRFGQAGDAGVIQLTSTPVAEGTSGRLSLAAGDYGFWSAGASVQGATASGSSDVSASIGASGRDGYITNTTLHTDVDSREAVAGRVKWRYRPIADLELSLHLIGQRTRDGAQALVPLGGPYHEVARTKEGESDSDFAAGAFTLARKFTTGTFSSTTSYSSFDLAPYNNRLVVFGGFDFDSAMTQSQDTFAEEIRYVTDTWSSGLYYSDSRTRGSTDRVFSGFPVERSGFTADASTLAFFGRANFTPTDGWVLTPGLRVEYVAKDFTRTETVPASRAYDRSEEWGAFLPSFTATRRFDATTDLSFTVGGGFKPGGYSAFTSRADLTEFDPQRNWGGEIAYSASPRGLNLTYTARAYAYWVDGYQIERSFAVPAASTDEYLVVNADRARLLGFELESTWRPTHGWNVTLAVSLTQSTLTAFTDPFTGASYSDSQVPFAPAGNGALLVEYRPAIGFFAGAGVTWTGTTYYDEQETAMFAQRSYSLVEAHAGYAFKHGELRVFGRNLTDEEYYSSITTGVGHGTPGAPLTWGAALDLRW